MATLPTASCTSPLDVTARFECKVCRQSTLHYNSGMPLCRGCGSFFQRCMKFEKRYVCKTRSANCLLTKDIVAKCKACRYAKCLKVWQETNKPSTSAITYNFSLYDKGITSVSHQLVKAYRKFNTFQLRIVEQQHSINDLTFDKYIKEPTSDDIDAATAMSINGLYRIFTDCVDCLKFPTKESWDAFTEDSQDELMMLEQCYLTSLHYDGMNDSRSVLIPGYIIDLYENCDLCWFEKDAKEEEKDLFRGMIKNYNDKFFKYAQKFKENKLDVIDVSVISLLIFIRHYEKPGPYAKRANAYKDRVLAEWAESLRKRYGEESHEKLAEFMMLYNETVNMKMLTDEISLYCVMMRENGAKLLEWGFHKPIENFDHQFLYT